MNRLKLFPYFLVFVEIFDCKVENFQNRVVHNYGDIYFQLISPECSYSHKEASKIYHQCPRSQCRVCIINGYASTMSAQSTTTPAQCPHSQRLRQHNVCIDNNYASTMSQGWAPRSFPFRTFRSFEEQNVLFLSFLSFWRLMEPKRMSVLFRSFLKTGKERKERNILLQRM